MDEDAGGGSTLRPESSDLMKRLKEGTAPHPDSLARVPGFALSLLAFFPASTKSHGKAYGDIQHRCHFW